MKYLIQIKRPTSSHRRFWVGRGETVTNKSLATQYAQEAHAKGALSRMGSYEKFQGCNIKVVNLE